MAIKYTPKSVQSLLNTHSDAMRTRDLVLGFATWTVDGTTVMETLYTQAADGVMLKTGPHVTTNEFARPDRTWRKVSEIPEEAQFIGTYDRPVAAG